MLISYRMQSIGIRLEIVRNDLLKREFVELSRIVLRMLWIGFKITTGSTEHFLLFHDDK